MQYNYCERTCRTLFRDEPETWCSGCVRDEAEDREANMRRWQEAAERQREFTEWAAANPGVLVRP